jgi:hypothetical protein
MQGGGAVCRLKRLVWIEHVPCRSALARDCDLPVMDLVVDPPLSRASVLLQTVVMLGRHRPVMNQSQSSIILPSLCGRKFQQ